jgi:TolB-like protein
VVLPFTNLNDDPEQQYFADSITEDLTTDLSRISGMLVISRNTAFTYRNKSTDTRQIGRELGVRYTLEGSVRRSGNQIRINAQLIDAEADAHLWAERFDCDMGDLFAVQNEITSRIAVSLGGELIGREAARPTENPDALDYILRGRVAQAKPPTRDNYTEAISWFEHALALDTRSVEAQSLLALTLASRVIDQMTASAAADITRAEELAGQALTASPRSYQSHYAKGQVLRAQGQFEEAISEYQTVIAFNRNSLSALGHLGWCKFWTGSIEELIPIHQQVIRLSPRDPSIGDWSFRIGLVHLMQSRIDEAIVWLEKARTAFPAHPNARATLGSAYALSGDTQSAAAELAEAKRLVGDDRYSSIAHLKTVGFYGATAAGYWGVPKLRALFETTYFAGLRKAGMPEE